MSERRDGAYLRKERLRLVMEEVRKHMPKGVEAEKIILWIMMEFGLTRRKAEEYLRVVAEMGEFELRDGMILPRGS